MRAYAVVCMLLLSLGCAGTGQYCADRGADAVDVIRLNVSYGPGLGAAAFATAALKLGVMGEHSRHVGLDGHGIGDWGQDRADWHLVLVGYEYGHRDSPVHGSVARRVAGGGAWKSPVLGGRMHLLDKGHVCGALEFGARAHALLIGAEAGIRLMELCNFVVGFAGFDLKRDDSKTRERWRREREQKDGTDKSAGIRRTADRVARHRRAYRGPRAAGGLAVGAECLRIPTDGEGRPIQRHWLARASPACQARRKPLH